MFATPVKPSRNSLVKVGVLRNWILSLDSIQSPKPIGGAFIKFFQDQRYCVASHSNNLLI